MPPSLQPDAMVRERLWHAHQAVLAAEKHPPRGHEITSTLIQMVGTTIDDLGFEEVMISHQLMGLAQTLSRRHPDWWQQLGLEGDTGIEIAWSLIADELVAMFPLEAP